MRPSHLLISPPAAWLLWKATGSPNRCLHRNSSAPPLISHLTLWGPWCVAEGDRQQFVAKGKTCHMWMPMLAAAFRVRLCFFFFSSSSVSCHRPEEMFLTPRCRSTLTGVKHRSRAQLSTWNGDTAPPHEKQISKNIPLACISFSPSARLAHHSNAMLPCVSPRRWKLLLFLRCYISISQPWHANKRE